MMRLERPVELTSRPRVSVVIPCYNYGRYLPDAVRSATTDQPGVDVDVLVVDDCSPDGSGDVARGLAAADPRVQVLQHTVNRGHLHTYNDGFRAVTGDYVVLLSADDQLAPGALARATALLEAHPSVGFAYGFAQTFVGSPEAGPERVRNWTLWTGRDWYRARTRSGRNVVVCPEVVMRREVLAEAGYYDLDLPHTADMYLWLRAAQIAEVGRVNGATQAFYRLHGANMHLTEFAGAVTDLRERLRTWDRLAEADPAGAEEARRLQSAARRATAKEAVRIAAAAIDRDRPDVPLDDLSDIARDAWPEVVHTPGWRLLQARRKAGRRATWMVAAGQLRRARNGARWHRWRRYGI